MRIPIPALLFQAGMCLGIGTTLLSGAAPAGAQRDSQFAIFDALPPALGWGEYGGRLYYRAERCPPMPGNTAPSPLPTLTPLHGERPGIAAVRAVFGAEPGVRVSQPLPGLIDINIGDVPSPILATRIERLTLAPVEQHDIVSAIQAIERNGDFRFAEGRLDQRESLEIIDHLVAEPMEGRPHLPSVIQGRTVEELLGMIATTFHALVVYQYCPATRTFHIDYQPLDRRSTSIPAR